jgi:hypothetical protein
MDVSQFIKNLPEMSKAALCQQRQKFFNNPAPDGIRKKLMVRMLAHRIQEQAFGGLNPKIRRRLDQMAAAISKSPDTAIANMTRAKPGTQLMRSWQGGNSSVC